MPIENVMVDCGICCEKFNNSSKKKVICLDCENCCCRTCHQTYLLSKDVIDCMFCQKPQSFEHITNSHFISFMKSTGNWKGKGYREHEEEMYFKNEMAMFPETQKQIEKSQIWHDLVEECRSLSKLISSSKWRLECLKKNHYNICKCNNIIYECICISKNDHTALIEKIKCSLIDNDVLEEQLSLKEILIDKPIPEPEIKTIENCMANNCNGFLNSKWKCNKCEKTTCKKCREIEEKNHVCNEDTVKTINIAISTSKPCPKCNERIHRIYGCDQVYCPICKVVFSYSSGQIQIGGVIHQPDAVKELRKNGRLHRDIRDIPCGGVEHIYDAVNAEDGHVQFPFVAHPKLRNILKSILRWCVGYEDRQRHRENGTLFYLNNNNRKKFLKGEITKKMFKNKIYNEYKSYEKNNEDRILFAGFYICVCDILRSLKNIEDVIIIESFIKNIFTLCENYNTEFERVNKLYNKTPNSKKTIFIEITGRIKNTKLPGLYFGIMSFDSVKKCNSYSFDINNFTKDFELPKKKKSSTT